MNGRSGPSRYRLPVSARFDLLVVGDANPDIALRGEVEPAFGQAQRLVEDALLTVGGSGAIVACGAARLGLRADGVSFHVGSQQRDPGAWGAPISAAASVFEALRADGLDPWLLDIGGGFPARLDG